MLRRLMMSASAGPGSGYAAALLALTPKFAWYLDEASGGLVDRTGNGNSAVANGTPLYGQPSLLPSGEGGSVYFSGDDYFTASAGLLGPFAAGWLSMWMKKDFLTPYRVLYGENPVGSDNRFVAYMRDSSNGFSFNFNRYNGTWANDLVSGNPSSSTSPLHVVFTGDASGRQIYINGVSRGADAASWQSTALGESHLGRTRGDPNFWKGWVQFAAGGNRKLSAAEVASLYGAAQSA